MSDKIARRGDGEISLPSEPIRKIEQLAGTFQELRKRCNLLAPVAAVDSIMPMHQVSLRTVLIDSTLHGDQGPDCYRDKRFCKDDEVALGKNGLAKLMGAAGIQIVQKRRLDDRSIRNYWEVEVVLAVRDFDGQLRQVIATKEFDLRDGAPETQKPERVCKTHRSGTCKSCTWQNFEKTGRIISMDPSAIADKRRHGQSLAETMAIERGLRLIFGLPQKFKVVDLQKPFVVPKLVPDFDMSDPEVKTAVLQHTLAGDAALYGPGPAEPRMLKGGVQAVEAGPAQSEDVGAQPAVNHEDGETAQSTPVDEDASEFGDPPPAPSHPDATCGCPCGHDAPITLAVAEATEKKAGSRRCGLCWPWHKNYDPKRHAGLATLGLKNYPELTPPEAKKLAGK